MSGTLFGIGLSQRWDARTNTPAASAPLYIYAAGTSTPVTAYKNAGLTAGQEHTFPILTDSYGVVPAFWLADGNYRARMLTSDAAVVFFDTDNIPAVGASSGSGSVDTTDPNAIFGVGDFLWKPISGVRSGWVRANARTIGSATSGGAERANADVENLFVHLWNTYSNTLCPVTSGRGASAAADWAANKLIATLDMRGKSPFGLSDMGNTDLATFTGLTFSVGNGITAASMLGAATITLLQGHLPNLQLDVAIPSGQGSHVHDLPGDIWSDGAQGLSSGSGAGSFSTNDNLDAIANTLPAMTGSTGFLSGGAASQIVTNKMPPAVLGTWFVRL